MPKDNPHKPFTPDPRLLARMPARSGNAVNGLGEQAFRRPEVVYWATDLGSIAHGDVQQYFFERSAEAPAFAEARARRVAATSFDMGAVACTPEKREPEAWTKALNGFVADGLCDMVGVAEMSPDWVYEGDEVSQSRVIVIGVEHDYEEISQAPAEAAGLEVMAQYQRAAVAAKRIAAWLRSAGWDAEPVTGPNTGAITLIPPALACGFGELGKHGSLINAEFGASFRLSAVLTDAPFAPTPTRDFGVDEFCTNCRICEDACPPEAIAPKKQTVRGAQKWYVDFDKCISFFNETHGCAMCIAVCPWSRPGVGLNLAAKLARRAARD
ncbi:MAG: 4Fe-4S dicluster domain-containing protein [Pseudomonadota bacterium]